MKYALTLTLLGILASCGTGAKIDGKTGAAQALLSASVLTTGVDVSKDLGVPGKIRHVDCQQEGSATLSDFALSRPVGTVTTVATQFVVTYRGCGVKTDSGTALLNGSMTFNQSVTGNSAGNDVNQQMKGKITISGAVDDFLDADILQVVDVSLPAAKGEAVVVVLKGTLTTTAGANTYDESLVVEVGTIKVLTVLKK